MTKSESLGIIEKIYSDPEGSNHDLLKKVIVDLGNFFNSSQLEEFAEFLKDEYE